MPKGIKFQSKFYNMDCMEGMRGFDDNFIDLAIVDPPYGIGAEMGTNKNTKAKFKHRKNDSWDASPPDETYFNELFRVSRYQVIWGANHFIERINKNSSCWIIWDKGPACRGKFFADGEMAWTSFNKVVRIKTFNPTAPSYVQKNPKIHPTMKPVTLYRWILKTFAEEGWIILDTHVGSGSSLIACEMEGFQYMGYEIDSEYYQEATKRIIRERSQLVFNFDSN